MKATNWFFSHLLSSQLNVMTFLLSLRWLADWHAGCLAFLCCWITEINSLDISFRTNCLLKEIFSKCTIVYAYSAVVKHGGHKLIFLSSSQFSVECHDISSQLALASWLPGCLAVGWLASSSSLPNNRNQFLRRFAHAILFFLLPPPLFHYDGSRIKGKYQSVTKMVRKLAS